MKTRIFKLWLCAMMLCMVNVGFADEHEYVGTPKAAYKSLDDYISESTVKVHSLDSTEIIPHINGITKVYVDLTKGTTNGAYCFLCIKNSSVSKKSVTFSSKYLKTSSDNLRIVDDNNKETIHNITKAADDSTIPFVYYNPQNSDEIIIDIYEYYGCFGFIEKWQSNFGTSCIVNIETADNKPSIKTMIYDATSQPMLVGGYIENYSPLNVVKKGIIVSKNADDMVITEDTKIEGYGSNRPEDIRFIDCTDTNEEEFFCSLQFLMGNTDYYVKAFAIDAENNVIYGETEEVHTQDFNRYNGKADYANVYYASSYTAFDLVTDEIININEGYYSTSNENPTTVRYRTGNSVSYKLGTEWNYKLWYSQWYHGTRTNNSDKMVHLPVMKYTDGKLVIEKNPLDADKDITIYYRINGNYFRPENYTDVYTQPLALDEECTVCCYAISSDGYISYTNMYAVFGTSCIVNIETADNKPSIKTMIYDATSQPMLVGGYIENYSPLNVVKKGIIVSKNADDMVITEETKFDKADVYLYIEGYVTDKPQDIRFIDCTETNDEEFVCALQFLMGSTDYYVKAFYIDAENEVHYGNAEKVHTQAYNRYDGFAGYGNVWYAFSYTLFDLVTDEIINPNEGFYYTTNENPTTVRYQTGTSYNTCYKLATEWNYKLWYYHSGHSDTSKHLHTPVMSYKNGKLVIEKNPLDADKNITIYYSINGNYFRPENYKDVYTQPLALDEECTVCCYAISSDGYISYTNMYAVMSDQVNDIDKIEDISVKGTSSLTQSHAIYNISGQRLSQPQKGINIIGGKKIVIK